MAVYKHNEHLEVSSHLAFDTPAAPGSTAIYSGIFRCTHCGQEIVAVLGRPLPEGCPRGHIPRADRDGWQLIVAAN